MATKRRATSTSNFGVSKREGHDASAFYERFTMPEFDAADEVLSDEPAPHDVIVNGDSSAMTAVPDRSVALVVTSPPYFAGKAYEEALGEGHIPATYLEYLDMLTRVFKECHRVLEPGGRIAINVANLGRRPYRSLSADVIGILEGLGFLLRGEVIWMKGRGASGSCAWGSFQRPANPVLRDLTERVIIASKSRFDRAVKPEARAKRGLPSETTLWRDEFMDATLDVWEIAPESAKRVNHPAPFPVELPERLIHLFTYRGDVVLDPFMGSGTTAVAAVRTGRHFVGYDTDPAYIDVAEQRVAEERAEEPIETPVIPAGKSGPAPGGWLGVRAAGGTASDVADAVLRELGFTDIKDKVTLRSGAFVARTATAPDGTPWMFDVCGSFTTVASGLRRSEVMWKALGNAAVIHANQAKQPGRLVLFTTDEPPKKSPGERALRELVGPGKPIEAIIRLDHEPSSQLSVVLLRQETSAD